MRFKSGGCFSLPHLKTDSPILNEQVWEAACICLVACDYEAELNCITYSATELLCGLKQITYPLLPPPLPNVLISPSKI